MLDILSFGNSQKAERKFGIIIEDNFYESTSTDIVDLALGMGSRYLNIKGLNKTEKISKVLRYAQIANKVLAHIPGEEPEIDDGNNSDEEQA